MIQVSEIWVCPIKGLDAMYVSEAKITTGGILEHDRVYRMVDASSGDLINGKNAVRAKHPELFQLRTTYDWKAQKGTFWKQGQEYHKTEINLANPMQLEGYLSKYFGRPVRVEYNPVNGYPDDTEANGPTVVMDKSLGRAREWFGISGHTEARRRFRPNIVLTGDEAFYEDRLSTKAAPVKFNLGEAVLFGKNPCRRCEVPQMNPDTGEKTPDFAAIFKQRRAEELPAWADRGQFDTFYRLTLNTVVDPQSHGKKIRVGHALSV